MFSSFCEMKELKKTRQAEVKDAQPQCKLYLIFNRDRGSSPSPSLFSRMLGANPPSSPTLVASWPYFSWITPFSVWYSSDPILNASLRDGGKEGRDRQTVETLDGRDQHQQERRNQTEMSDEG